MTAPAFPVIGITADDCGAVADGAQSSLTLPYRYLEAIEHAGAVPVVLPNQPQETTIQRLLGILNGLLLSGGDFDIHPRYYGAKARPELGTIKARRTRFELTMVRAAMGADMPILGICGGAQAINVALGGSLYQDIATELGRTAAEHTSRNSSGGHAVRIQPDSRLYKIFGRARIHVNTSHHQSVKRLGRGLIVNAIAEDGVIEGIESMRHTFVLGVQWHPEVLVSRQRMQQRLFSSFIDCCRKNFRPG